MPKALLSKLKMKEPPSFHGGMDGDIVHSFKRMVDTCFALTGIIKEQTRHKFASLLLTEDAANWYDMRITSLMLPGEP